MVCTSTMSHSLTQLLINGGVIMVVEIYMCCLGHFNVVLSTWLSFSHDTSTYPLFLSGTFVLKLKPLVHYDQSRDNWTMCWFAD